MKTASTVEEIYDRHVRKLPLAKRLQLAERIAAEAAAEEAQPQRRLLELEGVGAELWRAVEPQAYVASLREEWDSSR